MAQSKTLLDAAGLSFRRWPACDWRDLSPVEIEEATAQDTPFFAKKRVTPPEIACFLSHVRLWCEIATGDAAGAIVLEDDFAFGPEAADILRRIPGSSLNWDILKLYTDKPRRMLEVENLGERYRVGTPRVLPPRTLAYAVTRPAARALAAASLPAGRPIDLYLKHWWEHGASIKVLEPAVILHREGHMLTSSIREARNGNRANPVVRFARNEAYQLTFRFQMWRYAATRATKPRWPQTSPDDCNV